MRTCKIVMLCLETARSKLHFRWLSWNCNAVVALERSEFIGVSRFYSCSCSEEVTPASAPELSGNSHSDSCLYTPKKLKAMYIFPHVEKHYWSYFSFIPVVPKLFLIAYHLWVPYYQHVPPCSRRSQCAKYHSIKGLETIIDTNATWRKWLWESIMAIFRNQEGK